MDVKADKALLEEKISKNYFDSLIAHLDKNLQDMIYRFDGQVMNNFEVLNKYVEMLLDKAKSNIFITIITKAPKFYVLLSLVKSLSILDHPTLSSLVLIWNSGHSKPWYVMMGLTLHLWIHIAL